MRELLIAEWRERIPLRRWEARDYRLIELERCHGLEQRALAIEHAHDMLGHDCLKRHPPARAGFCKVVYFPPAGDQTKERLIEAKHALDESSITAD